MSHTDSIASPPSGPRPLAIARRIALFALLAITGCYHWNQVPSGVQQKLLDLPVDGMTQRYTVLNPQALNTSLNTSLSPSRPSLSPSSTDPPRDASSSKSPAVILLHSGFSGDETTTADIARKLAQRGLAVIMPAYRGEVRKVDGKRSDGKIEFCQGEVNDAQAALAWLRAQPGIDPARIGVMGLSHGGCISLRLAQRDSGLRAVATMSAPVAAGPLVKHLEDTPLQTFFFNGILASQIKSYVKATPSEQPQSYGERSPLYSIEKLTMPLLVIHGTADSVVPTEQACWLLDALRKSGRAVHESLMDKDGNVTTPTKSQCPAPTEPGPPLSSLARAEFLFLQGQNHILSKKIKGKAQKQFMDFIVDELTH